MRGDVAYVDFSESFRFNSLGIDGMKAQLRQVVYAATEFPTVKKVQFLIEGKKVDYLGTEGVRINEPAFPQLILATAAFPAVQDDSSAARGGNIACKPLSRAQQKQKLPVSLPPSNRREDRLFDAQVLRGKRVNEAHGQSTQPCAGPEPRLETRGTDASIRTAA